MVLGFFPNEEPLMVAKMPEKTDIEELKKAVAKLKGDILGINHQDSMNQFKNLKNYLIFMVIILLWLQIYILFLEKMVLPISY